MQSAHAAQPLGGKPPALKTGAVESVWLDETGTMILLGEPGPGIVDDRDLLVLSDWLLDKHGKPVEDEFVTAFVASSPGTEPELRLECGGPRVRVRRIDSGQVAERLCFDPHPTRNATRDGSL